MKGNLKKALLGLICLALIFGLCVTTASADENEVPQAPISVELGIGSDNMVEIKDFYLNFNHWRMSDVLTDKISWEAISANGGLDIKVTETGALAEDYPDCKRIIINFQRNFTSYEIDITKLLGQTIKIPAKYLAGEIDSSDIFVITIERQNGQSMNIWLDNSDPSDVFTGGGTAYNETHDLLEMPADIDGIYKTVDGAAVSGWAVQAMNWAVGQQLLQGKGANNLDPQGQATRAEVAQILMNYQEKTAK